MVFVTNSRYVVSIAHFFGFTTLEFRSFHGYPMSNIKLILVYVTKKHKNSLGFPDVVQPETFKG